MRNYLSCRVGREWYGVELDHISKVLHMVALTELPDAPPDILGLLTMQDRVIPVVDLRRRFKVQDTSLRLDTPIVVVDSDLGAMGLVVDDADDVEIVQDNQITEYAGTDLPYVIGVAKQSERLLMLLDLAQLLTRAEVAG